MKSIRSVETSFIQVISSFNQLTTEELSLCPMYLASLKKALEQIDTYCDSCQTDLRRIKRHKRIKDSNVHEIMTSVQFETFYRDSVYRLIGSDKYITSVIDYYLKNRKKFFNKKCKEILARMGNIRLLRLSIENNTKEVSYNSDIYHLCNDLERISAVALQQQYIIPSERGVLLTDEVREHLLAGETFTGLGYRISPAGGCIEIKFNKAVLRVLEAIKVIPSDLDILTKPPKIDVIVKDK